MADYTQHLYCVFKFEGASALRRGGVVSSSPEVEQNILFETSRPHQLFSEPTLPQKRFTHGCTRKFTIYL